MMKMVLTFFCISLMVAFAAAGIPLPQPGDSETNLSKNCQTPKCPDVKTLEDRERVFALPYPLDCLLYVECRGSEARVLPCPPDEVFDKNTFTCGSRHKVRCVPCYQETPQP